MLEVHTGLQAASPYALLRVRSIGASIYRREYQVMLSQLRAVREKAGLTQYDLAHRLGRSQSFVGKCELGERRLDLVQLRDFCIALEVPFLEFVQRFEAAIAENGDKS